ncbi:MAG TPA: hypothetical protein VK828_13785 [Terriglobales bacterium]|jgi:hypothetical protein|nr:hypothetical protein [Terriglobales bacterium]
MNASFWNSVLNSHRYRFNFIAIACLIAAALATDAVAQQASNAHGTPVHTIVTVEPHKGSEVPVVNREDVMVYEGKNRDQVTEWIPAQGDRAGLEFYVLIDDASSSALDTQLSDIKKFITALPSNAQVGVAYMQNGTARMEQKLTTDHDLAAKSLRLPLGYIGADASPYFALSDLAKHWQLDGNRHEVLMISSGADPYYGSGDPDDPYLSAAIEDCQRAGVVVSAIYAPGAGHFGHSHWSNYWGQIYLSKLTEETGGEGYYIGFFGAAPDFTPYLRDAANRLEHQYLLTFLAQPQKKAGVRSIKLKTELHNVDLVSANAVYVPASE